MRTLFLTIITALALVLWACTSGGSGTNTPADISVATPTPLTVKASCDAIQEIESYRYSITLRLEAESLQQPAETPGPLSDFTEALTALFSDMQLEGSFVAPDRSQALLRFQGQELELRAIGEMSWIRVGDTWQEQEPAQEEDVLLTPASVCADLVEDLAPSLDAASGTPEPVNGIATIHYRLDEADLRGLPELLGQSGEEGLPTEFGVDVWLERNDGWPVRLEITASDTDEEGKPISLELFMEFSNIDDPGIEIEPPPVSPGQA